MEVARVGREWLTVLIWVITCSEAGPMNQLLQQLWGRPPENNLLSLCREAPGVVRRLPGRKTSRGSEEKGKGQNNTNRHT